MTLEEIKLATQNFSDKNLIGEGGFAREKTRRGSRPIFQRTLFDYRHENIVGLEGYCNENDEKIIVYEHASIESLDLYLNNPGLTWTKRLKICIDIVRGLAVLHGGGPTKDVVHTDIKSANVLLYGDWKAKISDHLQYL
ncbi:putative receptor-like serine/threonine-protein kinase At4g34500 [Bidens hawaiensis]|uniref:putative receptor-like serine/threonine-protein kinase At4g34500 n=1 Tax=Bidens hawaiensis TaxID=980011 RepID=UPI0040493399